MTQVLLALLRRVNFLRLILPLLSRQFRLGSSSRSMLDGLLFVSISFTIMSNKQWNGLASETLMRLTRGLWQLQLADWTPLWKETAGSIWFQAVLTPANRTSPLAMQRLASAIRRWFQE